MIQAESPADSEEEGQAVVTSGAPPEKLFIYYLRGLAGESALRERGDFLGSWQEEDCSFLFFTRPAPDVVRELTRRQSGLELLQEHCVDYKEWLGGEVSAYSEGRVQVVPVWQEPTPDRDRILVRLDPGVVFGAGNHPTTRACLRVLQRILSSAPGGTVLDLGSGTGLLGVAAARLGAGRVLGMDRNPLAARTTHRNIRLNNQEKRMLAACGRAERVAMAGADLVLANIHFQVMQEIACHSDIVHAGQAILAGVFPGQAREIASVLQGRGMRVRLEQGLEREWPLLRAFGTASPGD